MSATLSACLLALKTLTWPHLGDWRGLPPCTLQELKDAFTVADDVRRGSGYVGEDHRALSWITASGGGFPDAIRAWLDGDEVVMMDAQTLSPPDALPPLVATLGEPPAKLDAYVRNALLEQSEWVYPERGLTLFVEPETHSVLRVAVYPRTTLADYRRRYRFMGGRVVR